jgi:poly-gamma-glutamate synthesis protein (capsule biosynthesis protein)
MGAPAIDKLGPAHKSRAGIHALRFGGQINSDAREYLKGWITEQKKENEILVVALHWGREKQTVPTPYQVALARACVDAGADVVWGHHPHVLQGAELYRGKPILYSMGNLISRKEGPTGLARIYFENYKFNKFKFLPLDIKRMRVLPVDEKLVEVRRSAFKKLSEAIQVKYPHKLGKALF